jgi:hypothetical protein
LPRQVRQHIHGQIDGGKTRTHVSHRS